MADDEPESDPDRAAILARRQRFIALALSGLAGAAACRTQPAHPCLNVALPDDPKPATDGVDTDGVDTDGVDTDGVDTDGVDTMAQPQPCLSPPQEPDAKPQPCLSPPK